MSELQAADTVLTLANELASRGETEAAKWLVWQKETLERLGPQLAEAVRQRDEFRADRDFFDAERIKVVAELENAMRERDEAREAVRVLEVDLALAINAGASGVKLDHLALAVEALEWYAALPDHLLPDNLGPGKAIRALAAIRGTEGGTKLVRNPGTDSVTMTAEQAEQLLDSKRGTDGNPLVCVDCGHPREGHFASTGFCQFCHKSCPSIRRTEAK